MISASRSEVWLADLNPTRGHEQRGKRPVLIVSEDIFNQGKASLIVIIPITSTDRGIPSHVKINPPEGGLKVSSNIICEAIRSISKERLIKRLGSVTSSTINEVEDILRILLRL